MPSPSGCPRCAMHHALYVKAHRQLQAAGRNTIELEQRIRDLEYAISKLLQPSSVGTNCIEKSDAG